MSTLTAVLERVRDQLLAEMRRDGFYFRSELRHDPIAWDINNGYCEEFGEAVLAELPPGTAACYWLNDLLEVGLYDAPSHYVVVCDGRYYDAECIGGVDDLRDLPIFTNRSREEAQS